MKTTEQVERLVSERRRMLMAAVLTFAVWYGDFILMQGGWLHAEVRLLRLVFYLFGLFLAACFLWLARWTRQVKANPEVKAPLNDESTVRSRLRAEHASMLVVMAFLVVGVVIASYADVSGKIALMTLIWVVVVSKLGFYLWYDRG